MSIPYSDDFKWGVFNQAREVPQLRETALAFAPTAEIQRLRAVNELWDQVSRQLVLQGIQSLRDTARLVLKTPIRIAKNPFSWKTRQRTEINTKMAAYSVVQFASVPFKFGVALVALVTTPVTPAGSNTLLNKSFKWTSDIHLRMSKLEALKEEGLANAQSESDFLQYKAWIKQCSVTIREG